LGNSDVTVVSDWLKQFLHLHTDDRQTETVRETTDGRAMTYSEREREFTFAKKA